MKSIDIWHKDDAGKYTNITQIVENGKVTYYTDGVKTGEDFINAAGLAMA